MTCALFNIFISRQLSEVKAISHQVVGSINATHEDIQLMYARFFGGEAASVKKLLKEQLGSIRARKMLSQIFQVYYFMCTYTHNICYMDMQFCEWTLNMMWLYYVLYR